MNDHQESDEYTVIRRCLQGEQEQFSLLVERYQSMAYTVAYRMLGDQDEANDVGQESFIAAYEGLKGFQFNAKFSTWLYRIVMNKCTDRLRSAKHRVSVDTIADVKASDAATPEENASSRESHDQLQSALNKLPPEYREAVVLKHIEELDYEEMSHILGQAVGTLKVRTYRGREMLKKALEEAGVTHG